MIGLPSGAVSRADMGTGTTAEQPTWLDGVPGEDDEDEEMVLDLPEADFGEAGGEEWDDDAEVFVGADDDGPTVDVAPPSADDDALEQEFSMMLERMHGASVSV